MGTQALTKFCKHCGDKIPHDAVICTSCGRQVEELKGSNPNVIINNTNTNTNTNTNANKNVGGFGKPRDKWVAFFLCLILGVLGAHCFYERKYIKGIIYLLTMGIGGIGVLIDLIIILFKPNPYYV